MADNAKKLKPVSKQQSPALKAPTAAKPNATTTPKKQQVKTPTKSNQILVKKAVPNEDDEEEDFSDILNETDRRMLELANSLRQQAAGFDSEIKKLKDKLRSASHAVYQFEIRYQNAFLWRIGNFQEQFANSKAGKQPVLVSPVYALSRTGYRLNLSLSLNGEGRSRGKSLSVFVSLNSGAYDALLDWPFDMRLYFTLLDQTDDNTPRQNVSKRIIPHVCKENMPFVGKPQSERNAPFGIEDFVSHTHLLRSDRSYVRNDAIFIKFEAVGGGLEEIQLELSDGIPKLD